MPDAGQGDGPRACLPDQGTKGDCLMRQLHIREPWADLAAGSEQQLLVELLDRIQVLENRMRMLEGQLEERLEPEPVGVS